MRARDERDEAFRAFVRTSSASLGRTAWFLTGDTDLAQDLVQEAYAKTYASWSRVRQDDAVAYARRILVNTNIDRWRRRHGEVSLADADRLVEPSAEAEVDERDRVARALGELPRQQRTVVVLRYADDLSEKQVAALLGVSVGAVKSAASRGLAALRALPVWELEGELR